MKKFIINNYFIRTFIWAFISTLLLLIVQIKDSNQLVIKSINVPALLREGETDYVILDCDYDLENISSDGLVVKWYFNDDNVEYQWIYGHEPQADPSASHIDLGYKASDDPYTMYRAMKLNNPTINLTGDYRCAVFTYQDEEIADATMIVYSTEKKFDLKYRKKIIEGKEGVELTCFAEGLYPQPTMDIYVNDILFNETINSDLTMRNDSKYDIMMQVVAKNEDLPNEAIFKCSLSIPKANYTIPRELIYISGAPTSTPSVTTNLLRKMEIQAINSSEPDYTDNGGDSGDSGGSGGSGGGTASKPFHSLTLLFIITLFTSICYQ